METTCMTFFMFSCHFSFHLSYVNYHDARITSTFLFVLLFVYLFILGPERDHHKDISENLYIYFFCYYYFF